MKQSTAIKIVFGLALLGTVFSGTLSYTELFKDGAIRCPSPGTSGTIWGYPSCVYGFFMFVALAVISGIGVFGSSSSMRRQSEREDAKMRVMALISEKHSVKNDDVQKLLGVSDATATRYLDDLEREGKIIQLGSGSAAEYKLK